MNTSSIGSCTNRNCLWSVTVSLGSGFRVWESQAGSVEFQCISLWAGKVISSTLPLSHLLPGT